MGKKTDIEAIAKAIEADAGEPLPDLRQALKEAQMGVGRALPPLAAHYRETDLATATPNLLARSLKLCMSREVMSEFVQRQCEAREYEEFLRRKVETGRASMRARSGRSNDEVEAEFAARRANVASQS